VFSVSSVSDFQRREDDAVAVFVHGPALLHHYGDTTLAPPDKVAVARPTGVGRAIATYEIPIEGRDE